MCVMEQGSNLVLWFTDKLFIDLLHNLKGIAFVDCMNEVCTRRKVDATLVESDSIKWVLLLLHLVDFTDDKAEIYLKHFLRSQSKVLKNPKCRIEVKKYVSTYDNLAILLPLFLSLSLDPFFLSFSFPSSPSSFSLLALSHPPSHCFGKMCVVE